MQKTFIPISKPTLGKEEKKAVLAAMDSGWITLGPKTSEFENSFKKYVGAKYAIAVSSATAGIHLSLIAAGIKEGDEVIAPVFTFAATINPILHLRAKPVLVDVDKKTFNINIEKIKKKITKKTKAIIPVHYAGQPVQMDDLMKLAKENALTIIEDAAHSLGASYKNLKIGTIGDMTVFSFHPIKNITTGDGGMVTTNNEKLEEVLRLYRLHGMNKEAWKRLSKAGNWYYEITVPGYKYNMTDIAASMGLEQLKKLDDFNKKRTDIAEIYNKEFSDVEGITIPYIKENVKSCWNLYSILLDIDHLRISRNEFIEQLKKNNIGSSVYFMPLHMHPYYQEVLGYKSGDFPIAEWAYERILSIPLYPEMSKKDVLYVTGTIKSLIHKYKK